MSDKNHLGQTNTFATQDRWSGEIFGLNGAENGWSGKSFIGQAKSQILSDQMSCKVSATFVNTAVFSASIGAWDSKLCIHLEGGQVYCFRENHMADVYFSFFFKFSIFPSLTPM